MTNNVLLGDWTDYNWPSWVPLDVRTQVEEFWSPMCGRTPRAWIESTVNEGQPRLGERVNAEELCPSSRVLTGKWVPCWNNIGRVVFDDGSFGYASTIGIEVL